MITSPPEKHPVRGWPTEAEFEKMVKDPHGRAAEWKKLNDKREAENRKRKKKR